MASSVEFRRNSTRNSTETILVLAAWTKKEICVLYIYNLYISIHRYISISRLCSADTFSSIFFIVS